MSLAQKMTENQIIGSCAFCVVAEGAPYGRIEASKIPLLPIESYYHVPIHPFFSAP